MNIRPKNVETQQYEKSHDPAELLLGHHIVSIDSFLLNNS